MSYWRGKHCLVTGASSGLGQALARELARRGAHVGLIARRERALKGLADELAGLGHRAAFAPADVTGFDALSGAVRNLETELGPCFALLASAGVYRRTDGSDYDAARAAEVLATNVIGVSHSVAAVLPGMLSRGRGHICVVSSLGGLLALPAAGAYCASKAAVAVLMSSIQLDTHARGVRVTTAFPGFIDTPMISDHERRTIRQLLSAEGAASRILAAVEQGRREIAFPFRTWLACRLAGWLPWPIYRRVMQYVPPLEEALPAGDPGT